MGTIIAGLYAIGYTPEQMAEISQFRHSPEAKKDRGFVVG